MLKLRLLLFVGLGASALAGVHPASAQVVQAPQQGSTPYVDDNLNGVDDSEEAFAEPVFRASLQSIEEQEAELPDAPESGPTPAEARAPVGGSTTTSRAQRVGIDPNTGALTPLANRPAETVQGGGSPGDGDAFAATGIRRGPFTLFPMLEQSLGYTSNAEFTEGGEESALSQTTAAVDFISDWSRHQLRGGLSAGYTNYLNPQFEDLPQAGANLELRLDAGNDVAVTLGGTADLRTESAASDDITVPAGRVLDGRPLVQRYTGFAEVARVGGRLRASLRGSFDTVAYSDADLAGGGTISQSTRDNTLYLAALRLGYEASAAVRPFVELEAGQRVYDASFSSGRSRDSARYALRGGVEFDQGEKMNGQIALGYASEVFDDSAREALSGVTVDGTLNWSPNRLTTFTAAATTQFSPSSTPGESGSVVYAGSVGVTRALRRNLSLNAQVQASLRQYTGSAQEETTYTAQLGAEWQMNRSLALFGTAGYETVDSTDVGSSYDAATIRGGIRLRR